MALWVSADYLEKIKLVNNYLCILDKRSSIANYKALIAALN